MVMISRGNPKESRAKVKEHGLTFPVALQRQWEVSRLYAMFATPVAYLIDESGIITHDVALGHRGDPGAYDLSPERGFSTHHTGTITKSAKEGPKSAALAW